MKPGFDDLAESYTGELPKRAVETGKIVHWIHPQPSDRALDVASGPVTLARILAANVKSAFALDLSHSMLTESRRLEALPHNLLLISGDIGYLPFPDATFDLLTCAYAFANFVDLPRALGECARVVTRSGRVAFMDVIAPDDPVRCEALNRLEGMRSEFHTCIRTYSQLISDSRAAGLAHEKSEFHTGRQWLSDWLRLSPALNALPATDELRRRVVELAQQAGLCREGRGSEVEFTYHTAWVLLRPTL